MDLFHLINSSEGLGSEDVDLDMPDGYGRQILDGLDSPSNSTVIFAIACAAVVSLLE
jgi:hypothetical protein